MADPDKIISTILKHESKRNTYKIALVRAINDVALEYAGLPETVMDVAIPLRLLAEFWLAYYWAFASPSNPIRQGHDATDFAFRDPLMELRRMWQAGFGEDSASEGFYLKNMMSLARKRHDYPPELHHQYEITRTKIIKAIQQPIRYAGTGEYTLFKKPQKLNDLENVIPVPGTSLTDLCLVIPLALWRVFHNLSLWIEALCIHEWSLFTETVRQTNAGVTQRGITYALLTSRPDNRRPLTWERNQVDILLMRGCTFTCPWTHRPIHAGMPYDLDHIVPISIRPINELWNLVPADPGFNSHIKRDRLPSLNKLVQAQPALIQTYIHYWGSHTLGSLLEAEAGTRFGTLPHQDFPAHLVRKTSEFISIIAELRNVALF